RDPGAARGPGARARRSGSAEATRMSRTSPPERPAGATGHAVTDPSAADPEARARAALERADRRTRDILDACLAGRPLAWQQGVDLSEARGPDLDALCAVADALRARQTGDVVTYVVNRNINFTNVRVKHCRFCAFS